MVGELEDILQADGSGLLTLGRGWSRRLVGFTAVVFAVVITNAIVTGALSAVVHRYQARVVWLVPLLAGVLLLSWLHVSPLLK